MQKAYQNCIKNFVTSGRFRRVNQQSAIVAGIVSELLFQNGVIGKFLFEFIQKYGSGFVIHVFLTTFKFYLPFQGIL